MFAASPAWMRRAMKSALATPDNILRIVGIVSASRGSGADLVRAGGREAAAQTPSNSCGINVIVSRRSPVFR